MTALPNPQVQSSAFRTYTEATNARIAPGVNVIFVGDLAYERDSLGTALTTRGGFKWSPMGQPTLAHWGVTGVLHNSQPSVQGYMATPTVDETTAIQAAFDWAVARGAVLRGDPTKVYGVTAPVVFGARNSGTAKNNSRIEDLNLKVIGGTWTPGTRSGTDPNLWTYGQAVLTIGKALSAGSAGKPAIAAWNVRVDANRIAPVPVHFMGASQSLQMHVTGERGTECDFLVGWPGDNSPAPIDLDGWSNTASTFIGCKARSFLFSERADGTIASDDNTGWWGLTGRTSHGLVVRGSDQTFDSCVVSTGLHSLILCKSFSNKFIGTKVWNGEPANDPASVTAIITPGASGYEFDVCTFQDGRVKIGSFEGKFVGCKFEKFIHQQIRFVSSTVGETAAKFVFVGNSTDEDAPVVETEGSGTWGDFAGAFVANQRNTGLPLPVQGKNSVHGGFEVQAGGRVKVAAISFTPVASTPGRAGEFLIADDGNMYFYTGTVWKLITSTTVV